MSHRQKPWRSRGCAQLAPLSLLVGLLTGSSLSRAEQNPPNPGDVPVEMQIATRRERASLFRARKAQIDQELALLSKSEAELRQLLTRDVHALYRLQRGGLLPIAGGLDSLVGHASRVAHLERVAERTLSKLESTRKQTGKLSKEAASIEAEALAAERSIGELESRRASLEREAAAAAALAAQQGQMAMQAERAERDEESSAARVSYGLTVVRAGKADTLAAQRGTLALPVAASASITPTDPMSDGRLKGLQFEAQAGTSVRAAASGRVAAVEDGADGVVIVLDHGERYQTIYRGLGSSDLEPGDAVSKSARLGTVGSAPIRFEVRRGKRNQDARSYLGL